VSTTKISLSFFDYFLFVGYCIQHTNLCGMLPASVINCLQVSLSFQCVQRSAASQSSK
jgi:hypothetical protein